MSDAQAKVHVLPILRLTEVSEIPGEGFIRIDHQINGVRVRYWRQIRPDKPSQRKTFRRFPIVLNVDGSPWEPAVLWLVDRARAVPTKSRSLRPIAQDLRDYKVFLDDRGLDWEDFSSVDKFLRPTYVYQTHLQELIDFGEIKPSTASRRMNTVIGLYRFAQHDHRLRFKPANKPWSEKKVALRYSVSRGLNQANEVVKTDLRITVPAEADALSDVIDDSGKLRPMTVKEHEALLRALLTLSDTEFSLMHYLRLLTGAGEMTIMTLRLKDFSLAPSAIPSWPYKLRCGPGTGVDTKFDKNNVYLEIPKALYQILHVYTLSDRAKQRRAMSRQGDNPLNYLFLTRRGNPYYDGKDDYNSDPESNEPVKHSFNREQSLREFFRKRILPEVCKTLAEFRYKSHDTRANLGLKWPSQAKRSG